MGSYGIGPARIAAAAVEQFADEQGISWPRSIAPWDIELVTLGKEGEPAREVADRLYDELRESGPRGRLRRPRRERGREVRRRRAPGRPAAAHGRQARGRAGRGRGAGAAGPGEAVAAPRRRRAGGRGPVARAGLTTQAAARPGPVRAAAARDARRRAAQPVDDAEPDRLHADRADPGVPGARARARTTAASRPPRSSTRSSAGTDYLDGMAARLTGQYSRLGHAARPADGPAARRQRRHRVLALRAAAALGARGARRARGAHARAHADRPAARASTSR